MTTSFDYQRIIARLIVDEPFYDSFVADRDEVLERFGLADADRTRLTKLDPDELAVFKDVVNSTREINFRAIFAELSAGLTEDAWNSLLERFRRAVVVRDSSDSADLVAFVGWLDVEYPGSRAAALARYQMLLQLMGSRPDLASGGPGTLQAAPRTLVFTSGFDFEQLFADGTDDLLVIGQAGEETIHYVLHGTRQDEDVSVVQLPTKGACLLTYLATPRKPEDVRAALAMTDTEFTELISEFIDAGLVVRN